MLALRIAVRYLVAKKSHTAVNVITAVSMAGVAVATMAMVVVLSVFNGFSDIAAEHLSVLDPPLMIERSGGGMITDADSVAAVASKVPGVRSASPILTERALLVNGESQTPVMIKGVATGYDNRSAITSAIIDGHYAEHTYTEVAAIQIAVGVANALTVVPAAENVMQLYVPRRAGRINPANPASAFNAADVAVSAVFKVDQADIDAETVIVPLDVARELLDYETEANGVEVYVSNEKDIDGVRASLTKALPGYDVLTRLEQRADAFRMISVEKWVTFMMLIFILVIAMFNVVSTLSLLVIEKRSNMATLRALGADNAFIRRVFVFEGWLVTLVGGIAGIVLGVALSLAQQWGHFVKLGADPSQLIIDSYPVRVAAPDIAIVLLILAVTGLLAATATTLLKK